MTSARLVVDGAPDPADLAVLEQRVAEVLLAAAGGDGEQEFAVFLRGAQRELLGGVSGTVLAACCELEGLWVEPSLRGSGLARALLAAAEAEARRRGCVIAMLHTYDALTHRLFEGLGYRTVGVLDDCLGGDSLRWYAKDLPGSGDS